jgi:hypothetical protein
MAQACHGALEAGKAFPENRHKTDSIIVIGLKNKKELEKAQKRLVDNGIEIIEFHEPDWDYGLTTFGTPPIGQDQRQIMKRYQLWKN